MLPSIFGPDAGGLAGAASLRSLVPASIRVDVAESDAAYTVKADVPGADKDALTVRCYAAVFMMLGSITTANVLAIQMLLCVFAPVIRAHV